MVDVEKLISSVKNYPILYDLDNKDYKNVRKKDQVWDEIGLELKRSVKKIAGLLPLVLNLTKAGVRGSVASKGSCIISLSANDFVRRKLWNEFKKKWKNLRDCYAKYVRSEKTKTGQAATSTRYYKCWAWAKQNMKNHVNNKRNSKIMLCNTPYRQKRETESSVDKILTCLQEKRKTFEFHTSNLTANEHMSMGFAKTVATFSARRQPSVKKRITNIVLEEELLQREEEDISICPD